MLARDVRAIAIAALSALSLGCGAREYAAEPIDAIVVDAQTKRPVAGALVVARWIARGGGGMHRPGDMGSVEMLETLTAADGTFHFDGWGPRNYEGDGTLLDEDPRIIVFKHGYLLRHLGNGQYVAPPAKDFRSRKTGPVRSSLWSGETIELEPFKGSEREFFAKVYSFFVASDLWTAFSESTPCDWKKVPKTVAYLENEKRAYRQAASPEEAAAVMSIRDRLVMNDAAFAKKGCGSPREFFKATVGGENE